MGLRPRELGVVLGTVCLLAVLFGAGELAVRRLARETTRLPRYDQFLFEAWGPFFRVAGAGGGELVQVPRHPLSPPPQRRPLRPRPGVRRIAVVGESSASILGRSLSAIGPAEPVAGKLEVLDMASGAASLEQVDGRFREALRCAPDAVVLLFGNNLFYRHPALTVERPALHRWRLWLRGSRLVAFLADRRGSGGMRADWPSRPGRLSAYQAALRRMAAQARGAGVRLIVCTVPANLRFPPEADREEFLDRGFLEARYLYALGRRQEAIRRLGALATRRPRAWWLFHLGDWLYREGDYAAARRHLQRACDEDRLPFRAASRVNGLIRRAAGAEGLELLDLEKLVGEASPHKIPGWESFFDSQHTQLAALEAGECLRLLARRWPELRPLPERIPQDAYHFRTRLEQAVGMSEFPGSPARRTAMIYMAESQAGRSPEEWREAVLSLPRETQTKGLLFSCVAEAFWRAGRRDAARSFNDEALRLAPGRAEPHLQRALWALGAGGAKEAAPWLRQAAQRQESGGEAQYFLERTGMAIMDRLP
jgi:tetratricopeptide (TPR) repeat protein